MSPRDTYTHGHHDSVLRSHRSRTVATCAAYLRDELRPGTSVLDVGCGPGTLSVDLARHVAPGRVLAIDVAGAPLDEARDHADAAGVDTVEFAVADGYDLDLAGDAFDLVHAHQVLQHVSDPVAMLRELSRVTRPGGTVAARDADYGAFAWYPHVPGLDAWRDLYTTVARGNGAEPDAGRHLLAWANAAGCTDVRPSASTWCFATPEDRAWWGGLWAERSESSAFATQALDRGLADHDDLAGIADAWRRWASDPDGWFVVPHGEVRCHPPA
ncbi:methyltransferase domain-containing protein [Salsipaludibacter albus]|uniref:methyltransferase domain-containing protein n=1 Tax=Salsipaludibacter albus TaxID=2849650 RepID=UPI001EE3F424|nr:methyltransferase domain-containing protein [Salsipaludibacter albus]MBY5163407.1 methyltransferase domain-containing protein [Salsipaludibacter albus]